MKMVKLQVAVAVTLLLVVTAVGIAWLLCCRVQDRETRKTRHGGIAAVPVETALIQRGPIRLIRTFSGSLEALAEFVVAPKVGGRVDTVLVNLSDTVTRGQVVAELDNDEYVQAVTQAEADLVVAEANLAEAESVLRIADRELERTRKLLARGIASDSEFDGLQADQAAKKARLQVARAQVVKAESSLQTAKIRLGYTQVTASWSGGDEDRLVAERYLDEGQTVAANEPLLLIVELDPIVGVVYVTEKDYARLAPGQRVSLITDTYPGERFSGRIDRIAPVFRKSTRQARVEMRIQNARHRLKPGMFIRVTVVLERVPETTVIPRQAVTVRDETEGVFVVSGNGRSVRWRPVQVGIQEGDRVQVTGEGLSGRVVTLGQQLLKDGAPITMADEHGGILSGPVEAGAP